MAKGLKRITDSAVTKKRRRLDKQDKRDPVLAAIDAAFDRHERELDRAAAKSMADGTGVKGFLRHVAKLRKRLDRELGIAKRPLTQPASYLDRERRRHAADRNTEGMATPANLDTGLSGGGFDIRTDRSGLDDDIFNPYHDSSPLRVSVRSEWPP